jgi:hypothetical protein
LGPAGSDESYSRTALQTGLDRLTKSSLKPQQRLYALRYFLIPKYFHAFDLGNVSHGYLKGLDTMIRKLIRVWLHIPKDTPMGFFYASQRDGGLGIPNILTESRRLRLNRLRKCANTGDPFLKAMFQLPYLSRILKEAEEPLKVGVDDEMVVIGKESLRRCWADRLYTYIGGAGLAHHRDSSDNSFWVIEASPSSQAMSTLKPFTCEATSSRLVRESVEVSEGSRQGLTAALPAQIRYRTWATCYKLVFGAMGFA